jgi:predicted ATPase
MLPYFLAIQAELESKAARHDIALQLLDKAENRVKRTGERWYLAEILRLKGETIAKMGTARSADAKVCLLQALETAKTQEARFWELRSALCLAKLEPADLAARQRVARIASTLTEGFDLKDIKAACSLIEKGVKGVNLRAALS